MFSSCFVCNRRAHLPVICASVDPDLSQRLAEEEAKSLEWLAKNAKKCKGCNLLTMKEFGCNRVKCRCGTSWCWKCGEVDPDYKTHYTTCTLYEAAAS